MDENGDERLEELVFECLERLETGDAGVVDEACRAHPELAGRLRAALERVGLFGVQGVGAEAPPTSVGPYSLVRLLGAGGMGVVYEAERAGSERRVAVKILRPEALLIPGRLERFRREARTAASLDHAGLVAVHDFGEADGLAYIAMDLVDGPSVGEALRRITPDMSDAERARALLGPGAGERGEGPWWRLCARLLGDVADALHYAHSRGVIHRDVKPSNLFLTGSGDVLLGDFGLARELGATRLTASEDRPGSLPYMAPEVLTGESRDDPRQDVYSLGVTFYEMLTLSLPFDGASREQVRAAILAGRPAAPRRRRPRIPRAVETVCLEAMAHAPRDRYEGAADLARDLARLVDGRPVAARRPGPLSRISRWTARRPRTSAAAVAALVVLPALFAWRERRARREIAGREARVREERDDKEAALRDVRRLADTLLIHALLRDERDLGVPRPERVDGAGGFDDWLRRADDVLRRLDDHVAALARVRARASARPPDAPPTAPGVATLAGDLALRADAARSVSAGREERLKELDRKIGAARAALFSAGGWTFAGATEGWLHHALAELVEASLDLEVAARSVRRRRDFAANVEELTIAAHRESWDEVIRGLADVRRHPRYGGLKIEPQRGLVPLGADDDSGCFEFAVLETGVPPRRDDRGRLIIDADSALVLVLLPGGTFDMGARRRGGEGVNVDPWARASEGPCRAVELAPFFISKFEMTQAQWIRATGDDPAFFREGMVIGGRAASAMHPVEQVDWYTARRVLGRLGLDLPTEAQWEYACRAGSDEVWWTGDERESLDGVANLADSHARENGGDPGLSYETWLDDGYTFHAPVGTFEANGFGLHDLTGNVWEWCRDARVDYTNPPRPGDGLRHFEDLSQVSMIIRGGSFADSAIYARSAARSNTAPATASQSLGLRPIRDLH